MGFTPSAIPNLVAPPRQMYAEWMQSQTQCPCRPFGRAGSYSMVATRHSPHGLHILRGVGGTEVGFDPSAKPRDLASSIVRSGGKTTALGMILGAPEMWNVFGCFGCFGGSIGNHMNNPNIISKHCKKAFMFLTNMCSSTMASNQIPCSS